MPIFILIQSDLKKNVFFFNSKVVQVEAQQPLLGQSNVTPGIHTIQESQQTYRNDALPSPQESLPNKPSTSRTGVPVKFIVRKKLAQNHIEELNFRIQRANLTTQAETSADVNPSVGDISDKDSEFNMQQLESTVSSLSDHSNSEVVSPQAVRNKRREKPPAATIGFTSIETDF